LPNGLFSHQKSRFWYRLEGRIFDGRLVYFAAILLIISGFGMLCQEKFCNPGTDVMILKIFLPKNCAKKLAFLTQNKAKF
jgi:hypothetical protein